MRHCRITGFTLVELVVTLTVCGILAVSVWRNISAPVAAFIAQSRRAELVGDAAGALDRMARELRLAVPNSVRVSGNSAIEFLRTLSGGRYREQTGAGGLGTPLNFAVNTGTFDVLGGMLHADAVVGGATGRASCMDGTTDCVVIFNTGQPGADAYSGDNIAGVVTASSASVQFSRADVSGTQGPFPFRSPGQRFFIVDTPVTLYCDTAAGKLYRYSDYAITASQTVPPLNAVRRLLADHLSGCAFSYVAGASSRSGLVNLSLSLLKDGEAVSLLQQVRVLNVP